MVKHLDYFASLVQQDESIPLFEAALSIAQDAYPNLDMAAAQFEVDTLAARLRQRLPRDASHVQRLRLLNHYFYQELGFGGNLNNYYDPDNSHLQCVIQTRRGIPISLAVVYMELAHQIGLDIRGISFPGHFLMKLSVQSGEIILDPFNGASLSREDLEERLEPLAGQNGAGPAPLSAYLRDAQPREILVRMLRNLKALYFERADWRLALAVQHRLVILLPEDTAERRDRGMAFANLECPQAALADIEAYLADHAHAPDAAMLRELLRKLQQDTKRLN